MKTLKHTLAIVIIAIFTISCSRNDDNPIPQTQPQTQPTTGNDYLTVKVDASQYTATGNLLTASRKTNGGFQIFTSIGSGIQIQMYVDNVAAIGTYPTTPVSAGSPFAKMAVVTGSPATLYESGECGTSGVITITAISPTEITGTFSFTGTTIGSTCPRPIKTLTEGSFKTPL